MSIEHSLLSGAGTSVPAPFFAPLARIASGLLSGLLLSVAAVLIIRRLAGALEHPLSGGVLAVVAVLATATAVVAQRQSPKWPSGRVADELTWWLPAVALVPIMLTLTLPETSWAGLAWLWLVPIATEAALGYRRFVGRGRTPGQRPSPRLGSVLAPQAKPSVTHESSELEPVLDPQITQQLTRRQTAEGIDLIEGWLRAILVAGQRTTHVHVSFCPPFASIPELEFEQSEGQPAPVRVGQLLPYGARFEVKLDATGPAEVLIAFSARGQQIQN